MMGFLGSTIFIGAIGIGSIIISYLIFSFGFMKSITTGFVSQSTGSRDYKSLFKSIYQLLFITILISFLILKLFGPLSQNTPWLEAGFEFNQY